MTSPFSKPGRDQTVPDDDPIVPDGDQAVLDDGRTAPADDIRADDIRADGAPASDPIVLDSDQAVLDDGRTAPADDTRADDIPAGHPVVLDDDRTAPADDIPADDIPASDPIVLDSDRAALAEDHAAAEDAVSGTASAVAAPAPSAVAAPASSADDGLARQSPAAAGSAHSAGPWPEIQAMFVDDPRASVERAAVVVDEGVEALIVSVKEEQHALLSDWQGNDTATEELRTAIQRYRTFWNRVEDFSRES
jgi:hypothetical protein